MNGTLVPQNGVRSPSDQHNVEDKEAEIASRAQRGDLDDSDEASLADGWTESTDVPRRHLGFIQVSALMINQMVGSGIFTTPATVLLLTGSKPVSLVLWAVGGVYSFLG